MLNFQPNIVKPLQIQVYSSLQTHSQEVMGTLRTRPGYPSPTPDDITQSHVLVLVLELLVDSSRKVTLVAIRVM